MLDQDLLLLTCNSTAAQAQVHVHTSDVVFECVPTGYTAWSNTSNILDQLNMPIIEQQGDCLAYTTLCCTCNAASL